MTGVRYTLLADGTSDRSLMPILDWALTSRGVETIIPQWADPGRLRAGTNSLRERLRVAIDLYPCDILFVHRDAEKQEPRARLAEIDLAIGSLAASSRPPRGAVPVVPVRMTEAWILFDERAIRRAAGNPNGRASLSLPSVRLLEDLPDPKRILHQLLSEASEFSGRRLRSFRPEAAALQVAAFIDDFTPLRQLPAFRRFEVALAVAIDGEAPDAPS